MRGNLIMGLILLMISSCSTSSNESILNEYKTKNASLMAEKYSLENELSDLLDENIKLKKWVENMQKSIPEYVPFSKDLSIESFLFKKYDGVFPFGFASILGYHIESSTQLEDSVIGRTNVFIMLNVDEDLYNYLEEIAQGGNGINYFKDSKLGVYFEPDDLDAVLRQEILSSTEDNPIKVFGFFQKTDIGGADHQISYFIPLFCKAKM